ncbi:MAG: globin-coupled sensor protein [Hydrogenophaga sp.]|uniref:methyl-accepting chemotaxis protein n=1 Tax=Hydrogenophaga sp. TaxID=1904254 RepID=UPI0025BFDA47|nr:globin-coupled sensor protein [Hydrogenophaga sp.]MBU7575212.1 globin-coupled sensor protein [Hydrogenophaga sp.]
MSTDPLQERLDYYGLSDIRPSSLAGVGRALKRRLDTALDAFYRVIASRRELAAHFDSPQQMGRAKMAQAEHWQAVFRDGVDQRFYQRAMRIGNVHARIGLEPKWYVGAYGLVLDELITAIIAPGWRGMLPWKRAQARQVAILVKVALLDIDLALSGYFHNSEERVRMLVSDKLGTALRQVASGDLTARIDGFPPEYRQVEEDFNGALGTLAATLGSVMNGMSSMNTGATEIRSAADDLSRRTEEQAANLEETASAIGSINASVQESAATSAGARATIADTSARAADGSQIVTEAVSAMHQIESSSQEITSIIAVIESISFQTNLLALNAGVEAARAGEAGKGFAVVANEVRALAQRCAEAADEVKALISSSSVQVSRGVDLVGRSGDAFAAITRDITALSEAIQSIATSAAVQAESLAQITTVVGELDRSTQQNAAMAEECTAAATSLTREAGMLNNALAQFTVAPQESGRLIDLRLDYAA